MRDELNRIQDRLGHTFRSLQWLERALTHRSFAADHNERLEFLGDSVLNLVVSHLLFERMEQWPEGELSRTRANLVKQETLVDLAHRLGLSEVLRLGEGERRSGGQRRPSILADALEAVIGAIYLDAGFDIASGVVRRLYADVSFQSEAGVRSKDAKTALQEWLQGRRLPLPCYRVVAVHGAAHEQVFEVVCEVAEKGLKVTGQGASRRAAEQVAAAAMMSYLANP